jgi:hypothetical protein
MKGNNINKCCLMDIRKYSFEITGEWENRIKKARNIEYIYRYM